MSGNLSDYYHNGMTWAPENSLSTTATLPDGTPLSATTTALSGRSDQFYQYDIHIGPQAKNISNTAHEEPKERQLRAYPQQPETLMVGQYLTLLNGDKAVVTGSFRPSAPAVAGSDYLHYFLM